MNVDLLGYVLNALDPDQQREVEAHLATNADSRRQLDALRQCLEPLEADRVEIEPPRGLVVRTLGKVAEYCCRDLPQAPTDRATRAPAPGMPLWRRADVLVAATVLLTLLGAGAVWLSHARYVEAIAGCKDNLLKYHTALVAYGQNHGQKLPNVAEEIPPRNVAGMVAPILVKAGTLPSDASVVCPAKGEPRNCPMSFDHLQALDADAFRQHAQDLFCCYAYSLGYRDPVEGYQGPRFDMENRASVPIMADAPPANPWEGFLNSPNHGGNGQNILFLDGHVVYSKTREVNGDDIYLNEDRKQAAGLHIKDAVLGSSASSP